MSWSPVLRTIIVDDEVHGRQNLLQLIQKHCPQLQVDGLASSVEEASEMISDKGPDVVFLDVQMPGCSGFDLLKSPGRITFSVVIVSAHAHYGIQAVKADAVDYLLKPIRVSELKEAVRKVQSITPQEDVADNAQKIAIPHAHGVSLVSVNDIEYLEADNMYTTLHLASKRPVLVSRGIKEFEVALPASRFVRIHKSFIVNLDFVHHFHRLGGGEVELMSGANLPVSRRRLSLFQDALSRYAALL